MYPTTKNYTKEYNELIKSGAIVTIENLSGSIVSYLEVIIEDKNRNTEGSSKINYYIHEAMDNNWDITIAGRDYNIDELVKIADALMLYRYGERVQVNGGQKIGD